MSFWMMFGFFGIIWVPAILMFLIGGVDIQHKIGGSLVCLAFWFLMSGGMWFQEKANDEAWNNGFCDCGQHWELNGVTRSKNGSETKYYSCPDCYTEIQINH